jgi:hypothetical protein
MDGTCIETLNSNAYLEKALDSLAEVYLAFDFIPRDTYTSLGTLAVFRKGALYTDCVGSVRINNKTGSPATWDLEVWLGQDSSRLDGVLGVLEADQRYHIEVRYKPSSGVDGIFQVKLDGTLVIDFSGATSPTSDPLTVARVGCNAGGSGATDVVQMYFDNVQITTDGWPADLVPPYQPVVTGGFALGGRAITTYTGRDTYLAPGGASEVWERGGFAFGGETTPTFIEPEPYEPEAEGGFALGGMTFPTFVTPTFRLIKTYGGFGLGGRPQPVFVIPGASLTSTFAVPQPTSAFKFGGGTVGPTFVIPGAYRPTVKGGFKFGGSFRTVIGFVTPSALSASNLAGKGGFAFGGQTFPSFVIPPIYTVPVDQGFSGFKLGGGGGAAFITSQIYEVATDGGFALSGQVLLTDDEEIHDTYCLNGQGWEPSVFTGWNFNSFAVFRGKAYGCNKGGLYLLEGEDDDGVAFQTGVRLVTNFGSDSFKRIRSIRVGDAGDDVMARVAAGKGSRICYPDQEHSHRIRVSRDIIGPIFTIDVAGFEKLSQLEITPLILFRK